jgi:hypothetical protein
MMAQVKLTFRHHHLLWWQWGKILGLLLPVLLFSLDVDWPLLWALAAHIFVDFTAQSSQTAIGKAIGDWRVLAYHAFIAGGYPGLVVGGLEGLVLSSGVHFLVDATNKFGLDEPMGSLFDQSVHILTIAAIWWLTKMVIGEPFLVLT